MTDLIKYVQPDILNLQEVCPNQYHYIHESLGEHNYRYVGVPREYDPVNKVFYGEAAPIFFSTKSFKLVNEGTFWLSETPSVPGSKSWDSDCTRICTWARLESDRGRTIFIFNAHWDNVGKVSRSKSSEIIKEQMLTVVKAFRSEVGKQVRLPLLLLVGDFNSDPNTEEIRKIEDPLHHEHTKVAIKLENIRNVAERIHGPDITFTGFAYEESYRSDYMYVQEGFGFEKEVEKRWKVDDLHVLTKHQEDGCTPLSDHRPVVCYMSELPSIEAKIELSQI